MANMIHATEHELRFGLNGIMYLGVRGQLSLANCFHFGLLIHFFALLRLKVRAAGDQISLLFFFIKQI